MADTRGRGVTEGAGRQGGAGEGSPARRGSGKGFSATTAARTRTMAGETVEFSAVDYRAPEAPGGTAPGRAPKAVDVAPGAAMGRAVGVSSLRRGRASAPSDAGKGGAGGPGRSPKAVVAAVVACAAVVFALAFLGFGELFKGLDEGASSESSVTYATDSYTLIAVAGDDGGLSAVYLGYVDSINERVELCSIDPAVEAVGDEGQGEETLADVYGRAGASGLADAVSSLALVEVRTWMSLDESQMGEVFSLCEGTADESVVSSLVSSVPGDGQGVTAAALYGLLLAVYQIGSDNYVLLQAPLAEESQENGRVQLDDSDWLIMVRGMRDSSSDVSNLS